MIQSDEEHCVLMYLTAKGHFALASKDAVCTHCAHVRPHAHSPFVTMDQLPPPHQRAAQDLRERGLVSFLDNKVLITRKGAKEVGMPFPDHGFAAHR